MDSRPGRGGAGRPRGFYGECVAGLIAFAEHEARLAERVKDDKGQPTETTQRECLEAAAKRGDRFAAKALDGPDFPECLRYLWGWFLELDRGRQAGYMGAQALSYADIDAWARLADRHPRPHEVAALMELDRAIRDPGKDEEEREAGAPTTVSVAWPQPKG